MKKLILFPSCFLVSLSLALFFFGCKKNTPDATPSGNLSIISITPMQDTVGAQIVINGTGFSATASEDIVKFGDVWAVVLSVTPTKIIVAVPAGAQGGPISVSVNGNSVASTNSFTVLDENSPLSISRFSPLMVGVGYYVFIPGTGFSEDETKNIVSFNGVIASSVHIFESKLMAFVPLTATTGKLTVTVNGKSVISDTIITIKTATVTTIAGGAADRISDGTGTGAGFYGPAGIINDGQGNFYVADALNNKIRKVTPDGVVTTYAGTGEMGSLNGPVATASFGQPNSLAFDSHGNLFVSCNMQRNIRKITPDGIVSTFAGDPNGDKGYIDATGTDARFGLPMSLTIDKNDNIFVADQLNKLIRKITPSGVVSTFAGSGETGSKDSTGVLASFNQPYNLCIDANDNLYLVDPGNRNIRKITPAGVVTTFAGTTISGAKDGPALSATFFVPMGIVADAAGNFYVTDGGNQNIRMITSNGIVVTLAGNGVWETHDGIGGYASFSQPHGITVNANGEIYITDNYSGAIRKMVVQ